MHQLMGERRGDGEGEHAVRLGEVREDEDLEGAIGAGGAVPAFAGGFGALAGGGKADGDAEPVGKGSAELSEGRLETAGDIVEPALAVEVLVELDNTMVGLLSR